jgi:hypothetical protein
MAEEGRMRNKKGKLKNRTYSKNQTPSSKPKSRSFRLKILRLLWNSKVRYRAHKRPLLDIILSLLHPINTLTLFNLYLCLVLRSGLLTSSSQTKIMCIFLISPTPTTCPSHFILLDLITLIVFYDE